MSGNCGSRPFHEVLRRLLGLSLWPQGRPRHTGRIECPDSRTTEALLP